VLNILPLTANRQKNDRGDWEENSNEEYC
jgi:hypothetical protein